MGRWPYFRVARYSPACLAVVLTSLITPKAVHGQTASSELLVTAQVINSCSFDTTMMDLLSVTCSLDTPMATSIVAASTAFSGNGANITTPNDASGVQKSTIKLCNSLASSILENGSFNQFTADVTHKSQIPSRYFSTFQVCF